MSCGLFQSKYYDPEAHFTGIMGDIKELEHIMLQQIKKTECIFLNNLIMFLSEIAFSGTSL